MMCVCVSVSVFMCTYCTYMYIIIHVHSYGSFLTHFCYYELANLTYYYCTYYVIIIIKLYQLIHSKLPHVNLRLRLSVFDVCFDDCCIIQLDCVPI